MKLADMQPKKVQFTVSDVSLTFRPFTIADDLRAQTLCGGEGQLVQAWKDFDFKKLSLVAWYQLDLKSQKFINNVKEIIFVDPETGDEQKAYLTPIEKFRNLFQGMPDQIGLLTNLIKCKGLNIPDLDDEENLKKWVGQFDLSKLTGP